MSKVKKSNLDISPKDLQNFIDFLDPVRTIQDLAANAAEIIASEGISTNWNDVLPVLEDNKVSEQLRLAAHIIFRARLLLEEMEKDPSVSRAIYNTILMMHSLELANIKGLIPFNTAVNFNKLKAKTSSINLAVKKERIIDTIRELAQKNPNKGITWLRKRASELLSSNGKRGYSYRQILRDTKGIKIKS